MSDEDAMKKLMNPTWRLTHLYQIRTKVAGYEGKTVTFYPNRVQRDIFAAMEAHNRVIILKPRKLGCTTAVTLYLLDKAMYTRNQMCRTIAHRKQTVGELFNDIVMFAFNRIPETIKVKTKHETRNELNFASHGSKYSIDVEARGLTPTYLHFSEVAYVDDEGKLQDSLESLPLTAHGIVESTANGKGNWFERTFMRNWELMKAGEKPEWFPMFFAWFDDTENQLPYDESTKFYFEEEVKKLKAKFPKLTKNQLLWWDRKRWQLGERMPELYPSEPEEAFIFSTGKVYSEFYDGIHVLPPMAFKDFRVAMDYGQTNPTVFLFIHKTNDGDFVVFDEFYKREAHPREGAEWLKQRGVRVVHYPDPSCHNRTQIQTSIKPGQKDDYRFSIADEYRNYGISLAPGAQNDIPTGIVRMKEYLRFDPDKKNPFRRDELGEPAMGSPRLFITSNCVSTIREFGLYRWPDDPSGTLNRSSYEVPRKENDHAMDALRYALLSWGKPVSKLIEEQVVDPRTPKGMLQKIRAFAAEKDQEAY